MRRARRSAPPGGLSKVVFACYGALDCNSAIHIAGFARELQRLGYAVAVAGRERINGAYESGPPPFEVFTLAELARDPKGVIGFDGRFQPERTALYAWTPRKASRTAVRKALRKGPMRYLVHLEDNEDHLSDLRFSDPDTAAADRGEREAFLSAAAAVSYIAPRLAEVAPPGKPSLWLEPGVDPVLFETLPPFRRGALLRAIGVPTDARVLIYPGNVHHANQAEVAALYAAVAGLRAQGRNLVLVKTGRDDPAVAAALASTASAAGLVELGLVPRPMLLELIKCADLFVQPGAAGPFNDFRLPSKLPEVMAAGRPVILPAANLGLRLKDGEQALLLRDGSAAEIAGRIAAVLDDPALAARLGRAAGAFARKTWRWDVQGRKLAAFLDRLWRPAR